MSAGVLSQQHQQPKQQFVAVPVQLKPIDNNKLLMNPLTSEHKQQILNFLNKVNGQQQQQQQQQQQRGAVVSGSKSNGVKLVNKQQRRDVDVDTLKFLADLQI
jgi:hypothetical protein